VSIVNSLDHPNIYKILGVGDGELDPQNGEKAYHVLFILMEYAENGELFDLISSTGRFSEDVARHFFIQLLDSLNYMHNNAEICHRDIKPENILIDKDFNIKMADFGFATKLCGDDGSYVLHDYMGTLGYMPPE
jgi:serine/threonine protein kinase